MRLSSLRARREWLWRCLLVLLSTAFTFGIFELAVRIGFDRYQCNDQLGWTYLPGKRALVFNRTGEFSHFVSFNGDGLRDREPPLERDLNAFRILLLGDSFSASLQVPQGQSFPKLVEDQLASAAVTGRRIEVRNAAVDGFGTAQSLRMFVMQAEQYQPNVVLLGFFLANDLADNVLEAGGYNHYLATRCGRPYFTIDGRGQLENVHESRPLRQPSSLLDRLLRRSQLYANLFPRTDTSHSSFADWDVFTGKNPDAVASAWRLTLALVNELDRQVKAKGGKLIVLLIPHEQEALHSRMPSTMASSIDYDRGHVLAEAFLREAGIAFIDLYPPIRQAVATGERPYFRRDMHWNERGHGIVAAAILNWLIDHCTEVGLPLVGCRP
jgi:hypothetical protein